MLNKIKQDQIQARKDKNAVLASFLTTLLAEASRPGLDDGKRDSTDAEVIAVLKKFIKNANEVISSLDDNDTRAKQAFLEIDILNSYLPQQLSEDELQNLIASIIGAHQLDSMKGLGIIMKELNASHKGLFDGAMASKLAKQQLGA